MQVLIVALLTAFPLFGGEKPLELVLKPVALVRDARVTVADLCEMSQGADAEESRLFASAVGPAPAAGTVVVWTRKELEPRLEAVLGRDVVLTGAETVYVTVDAVTIRPEDVARVAERWLAARAPVPTGKLGLRAHVLLDRPIYLPRYMAPVRLTVQPNGAVPVTGGRLRVDVLITAGGRHVNKVPVYFESGADREGMDRGRAGIRQATAEVAVPGRQRPPVIERRQPVNIRIRLGGLSVIARGQALESGREGEFIRVRNSRSGRVLTARVVDSETVEIPF